MKQPMLLKEVKELAKLNEKTIRNLIARGILIRVKGIRHIRITAESVERWLSGDSPVISPHATKSDRSPR